MPLRRFQPISRSAQWSDTISWTDPVTRQINSLVGVTLTLALYQRERARFWDYGFVGGRGPVPILTAQTQADGSGPFAILPDNLHAQWTFLAGTIPCLHPGEAHLCIWATANGNTDQITDAAIQVLDGPRAIPLPVPVT